jgi:putative ABC transport system permease protein
MLTRIAWRNILRNRRRSLMTISAIAVSAIAMVLFAGYTATIILGFQTDTVQRTGHLTVYKRGYFTYGAGNPAVWGISHYQDVVALIAADPVLAPMTAVLTPTISLYGIAGNFDVDASRTFIGTGIVPSDNWRMHLWNDYGLIPPDRQPRAPQLDDADDTQGFIGVGLARVLGLCERLKLGNCPPRPPAAEPDSTAPVDTDLQDLAARDRGTEPAQPASTLPRIDLLAATAGGAPNIVSLFVARAERQGVKELDDATVVMNFRLAQRLLFGRGEAKTIGIVLQLHHTGDMAAARRRLDQLIAAHHFDLEVRDFTEQVPFYTQVIGLFGAIFTFIAAIMGVIVLFTVVNTMSMSVMERTAEIGTARALGVRRRGIRRQFVLEGAILGLIGATVGLVLGVVAATVINHSGLTWLPPGQAAPVPLYLLISGMVGPQAAIWLGLVLMSTLAALFPANRAARLRVVEALRHV